MFARLLPPIEATLGYQPLDFVSENMSLCMVALKHSSASHMAADVITFSSPATVRPAGSEQLCRGPRRTTGVAAAAMAIGARA